jgi:hypothetical protein
MTLAALHQCRVRAHYACSRSRLASGTIGGPVRSPAPRNVLRPCPIPQGQVFASVVLGCEGDKKFLGRAPLGTLTFAFYVIIRAPSEFVLQEEEISGGPNNPESGGGLRSPRSHTRGYKLSGSVDEGG